MQHLSKATPIQIRDLEIESVTSKIDGVSAIVGKDENGFYARRGDMKLYENDTSKPSNNPLNFAREALRHREGAFEAGTEVQVEVVSEPRPNVVKYDSNLVIPLSVVSGAIDINYLQDDVSISVPKVLSKDGKNLLTSESRENVSIRSLSKETSLDLHFIKRKLRNEHFIDLRKEPNRKQERDEAWNELSSVLQDWSREKLRLPFSTYGGDDIEGIVLNGKYKAVQPWFNEARTWLWSYRDGLFNLPLTEPYSYSWRSEMMINVYKEIGDSRLGTMQARHVDPKKLRFRNKNNIFSHLKDAESRLNTMLENYYQDYSKKMLQIDDKKFIVDPYVHKRNLSSFAYAYSKLNDFKVATEQGDIQQLINLRRL